MKKIRVGFVGLGRGKHLAGQLLSCADAEIGAVCDCDPVLLKETACWLGEKGLRDGVLITESYREMLADRSVDAVVVATPAAMHVPMVLEALDTGHHVLSEIPAVNSVEEAYILSEAVAKHPGLKYMTAENCCFWAFINTWKSFVEDGTVGRVWYAEAEYLHNVTELMRGRSGKPTWRASYDSIKYLTHDLGPLLYLLSDRVTEASGFAPSFNSIPELSTGTPNEVGIFRTAKGALIKILVSFSVVRPMIHNYCVYGTRATLETDRVAAYETNACMDAVKSMGCKMFRLPTETGYPGYSAEGHGGADAKMLEAFIGCIVRDTPPPIGASLGINISLPGIIAHQSAVQGSRVLEIPKF